MLKSYYSTEELIQLINLQNSPNLSYKDLKDLCLRGSLTPAIYFEGNIVCIKEQRYQDSPIKSDPVVHIEEVHWSMIFKGYIHFSKLIDYLDPALTDITDVFFNFDKVVEFITQPTVYAPLLPLSHNEYLKAFPRMIDDDIQEKRWLREATHFKGNPFRASEIVFHKEDIDTLLNNFKNSKLEGYTNLNDLNSFKEIKILTSDDTVRKKLCNPKICHYSIVQAASLIAGDDPTLMESLLKANPIHLKENFSSYYNALTLIERAVEIGYLNQEYEKGIFHKTLRNFLSWRGIVIEGFNQNEFESIWGYSFINSLTGEYHDYSKCILETPDIEDPLTDKNFYEIKNQILVNQITKLKDEIRVLNEKAQIALTNDIGELKGQLDHAVNENKSLKDQMIKYKEKVDNNSQIYRHPCIDPSHPKFAPELELAIRVWEEKYINNYPTKYEDHSPAIDQILNEMQITNKRLIQRITVITNNKKLKVS